jgi:hypothetical protein
MIQVPDNFASLVSDLVKQLEDFEKAYGDMPKCH